ncbi:MAG: 2-oxo acid dehydrogenase subunit E2 [Ignavibacteria bacterium]|nr:2-oxo acid dehydrogenase subunit E2 [Bacteroidota bacterium]MSQ45766.1 2-oxo acid dehydrogenase subunit E2 [Ignavibacteria bacterium]
MATRIDMPKLSDTMEEGIILKWKKNEGDTIKQGEIIAEIQSDKADMELEAYESGVILKLFAKEKEAVKIGAPLVIIGKAGEDFSNLLKTETKKVENKKSASSEISKTTKTTVSKISTSDKRIKASPLAKRIAIEKGVELNYLVGTGPLGRIVKQDVENYSLVSNVKFSDEEVNRIPISLMRKTIARRLSASKVIAPHFYVTIEIKMDKVAEMREKINSEKNVKISYNDFIVKAVSIAIQKHPEVNSSWNHDSIVYHKKIDIGVAVSTDEGLTTPVVRNSNNKSLQEISSEIKQLAIKSKERKLKPEEFQGSTFTISNLGMFDVENFTAIINPPESAILAVGTVVEKPIISANKIVIGKVMKVTLSCDHRVIDGAMAGRFLQTLKQILESTTEIN